MKNYNFVKHKTNRYIGVILEIKKRNGYEDLYLVLIVKDRNGNIPRKRIIHSISSSYFTKIPSFNIDYINKDWFENLLNYE